ncbi:MAG: cyclase family protein [Armatimonadetes bacterium]|nr:cyclase family protein [Armatimonadota bacterium]
MWIDVTVPVRDHMVVWPGDPDVIVETVATVEQDGVMVSRLALGSHTGTHIDAPLHFLAGTRSVDCLDAEKLIGPCRVLDLARAGRRIRRADLEAHAPAPGERLLFKTENKDALRRGDFDQTYAALDLEAAEFLAEIGVALVGIDHLSIEGFGSDGHPVHKALLAREVVILEGLDLVDVPPGAYDLVALPLRLQGLDGSPARAMLRPLSFS